MEAIAAAATGGNYIVAHGEFPPGFWMYDEALPKPERDVAAAKREIEASGWQQGSDGVYQKAGRRLAASIYTRTDDTPRVRFAQILAIQVKACGIDISVVQGDFEGGLDSYSGGPTPRPTRRSRSISISSSGGAAGTSSRIVSRATRSRAQAFRTGRTRGGFSDPRIDALVHQLEIEYDVDRRAALFREYQELIAQEQPVLFAYYRIRLVAAAKGLVGVDGPLDLNQPLWASRPERIVLRVATAP
jgi:peptide/nickel transport system substrate-binding protein